MPQDDPGVHWDFRNECWTGKVSSPEGKFQKRSLAVKRRMPCGRDLSHLSFEDAKKAVYGEFLEMRKKHQGHEGDPQH